MNVKQEIFKQFFNAVKMSDSAAVNEAILNFDQEGLKIRALTANTSVMMNGALNKSAFDAYEAIGEVPVQSVTEMAKIVDRFGKKACLKVAHQDPFLVLEDQKVFKLKTINKETIENIPPSPKLESTNVLTIKKEQLNDFILDLKAIKAESFKIIGEPKKVTFYGKETHECSAVFNSDTIFDNFEIKFGQAFINALTGVEGDVNITFVKSHYPVKIQYRTELYDIEYVLAPLAADDVEEPKEEVKTEEQPVEEPKEVN